MSRILFAAIGALVATGAAAQPAPSPGSGSAPTPSTPANPPPPSPSSAPSGEMRMGGMGMMHHGLGPSIRLKGPGGAEVAVRCASGESTKACSDVVTQMMERVMAARPERRRDDDDMPRMNRERERDRDRY